MGLYKQTTRGMSSNSTRMIPNEDQEHTDDHDHDDHHHPTTMTTVLGGDNSITPKMNMDEDADEVTRKVAPSMVLPSFQPMMSTTTTSMLATTTAGPSSMPMLIPTHRSTPKPSSTSTVTAAVSTAVSAAVPVPPFVWELSSVPLLPHFHPVEQTAVFVPHMAATPTVVSARISAILRELAVEAVYDTTKAKIKCTTLEDQIEFRLRLYQGRAPAYRHGIIVELQRRFGTSLAFHAITQAILAAAQGKTSKTTTSPSATSTRNRIHQQNILPPAPVLVAEEEENEDEDSTAKDEEGARMTLQQNAESSFAMVSKMLHLPGFDSQYLALQILSSSVDAEKISSSMARTVATKLLRSFSSSSFDEEEEEETDQEQDEGTAVGRKVFRYIVTKDQGTTANHKTMSPDRRILRNMCLNILATALRATAYGESPTTLPRPPASLRCVLLDDVRNAPHHPNTAVLAARCLEHMLRRHDPEEEQDQEAIVAAFEIARQVGEARNTTLARQVETCMMLLLMVRRP